VTWSVRPGTLDDLPQIAKLHGECFADAWNTEFLGRLLAQPGAFSMVAADDGTPAGFVLARANAGEAEILSVAVRLSSRRRSLATALVQSVLDLASADGVAEVFLEVAAENAAARALYRRLGFREVGLRPAYYREGTGVGSDALILRRALAG
jgi:ribosomal-protein-alanine N-acetyltransferase